MRSGLLGIAALAAVLIVLGPAQGAPTLDDQVHAIANELMCPVCAGQTVAESNAQLAVQMREIIRQRLQQGQTREEILAYFVGQFGESVLAAPPRRGGGLLVWLAPPVALVVGAFIVQRYIRRHRPAGREPRPAPPPPTPQEVERIRRDLRELD